MRKIQKLKLVTVTLALLAWSGVAFCGEIHDAADAGDLAKIKALLAKGVDINEKDKDFGGTPLDAAASMCQDEVVRWLLQHGGKTEGGEIFDAILAGDAAKIKGFLDKGTDVNTKDDYGWTLLHWAARAGQKEVTKLLLAKGANVHAKTKMGNETPLSLASSYNRKEVVELLLAKGADANEGIGAALTKEMLEALFAKGADVKTLNETLWGALIGGADKDVVELCLAKGADLKASRLWLHGAVMGSKKEVVELLLSKGVALDAKDSTPNSPFAALTPLALALKMKRETESSEMFASEAVKKENLHRIGEIIDCLRKHGAEE